MLQRNKGSKKKTLVALRLCGKNQSLDYFNLIYLLIKFCLKKNPDFHRDLKLY